MNRHRSPALSKPRHLQSFTLIELLTVMAIIAILAAMTLFAYQGVYRQSLRARAKAEVQAISSALESFQSDHGAYPQASGFTSTNNYAAAPGVAGGLYQVSSQILYENLTGQTNYGDAPVTNSYFAFKRTELGNDSSGGKIYIQDSYGNSFGYFTGSVVGTTTNVPNNGNNFFDLWSTGGDTTGNTNAMWINNWGGAN